MKMALQRSSLLSVLKVNAITLSLVLTCLIMLYCNFKLMNRGYNKPSSWLVANYKAQAPQRREFHKLVYHQEKIEMAWAYLYNNLAPEVYCAEKIKVGTTDDGGKYFCSPQNLPNDCVIYALGIAAVITFEEDVQRYSDSRCRIIAVDSGRQPQNVTEALKDLRAVVVEAEIGSIDKGIGNYHRSLEGILDQYEVNEIEILKMDIEGAEHQVLKRFLDKYIPAQIMLEVHSDPPTTLDFLKMIASKGYYLFHFELNGRVPTLCEYAFIHKSKLERYGATLLAKYL